MSPDGRRPVRQRSPVETQLYQQTRHLVDVSPGTLARIVAGELVVPDRGGPVFDVVFPPEGAAHLE